MKGETMRSIIISNCIRGQLFGMDKLFLVDLAHLWLRDKRPLNPDREISMVRCSFSPRSR